MELPAKNRRVKTPSFTLVDQWQDPGPSGGFRQTNYYKSSPLRKHTKKLLALTVGHGKRLLSLKIPPYTNWICMRELKCPESHHLVDI